MWRSPFRFTECSRSSRTTSAAADSLQAASPKTECPERGRSPGKWQTERVTRRAASIEESDVEAEAATLSEDELIRRATADRAAGCDDSSDIEACLSHAADQNQAALDRLAK
jgi:hypothetical protein